MSDRPHHVTSDSDEPVGFNLVNEFAAIRVELDFDANGPRLHLRDLVTGDDRYLDPLEVQGIATIAKQDLDALVDPSRSRWKETLQ